MQNYLLRFRYNNSLNTEKNTNEKPGECFPSLHVFPSFPWEKWLLEEQDFHTWKVKLCESSQFLVGMNGHVVLAIST